MRCYDKWLPHPVQRQCRVDQRRCYGKWSPHPARSSTHHAADGLGVRALRDCRDDQPRLVYLHAVSLVGAVSQGNLIAPWAHGHRGDQPRLIDLHAVSLVGAVSQCACRQQTTGREERQRRGRDEQPWKRSERPRKNKTAVCTP